MQDGFTSGGYQTCPTCDGKGIIPEYHPPKETKKQNKMEKTKLSELSLVDLITIESAVNDNNSKVALTGKEIRNLQDEIKSRISNIDFNS